jgi:hypothetical protein
MNNTTYFRELFESFDLIGLLARSSPRILSEIFDNINWNITPIQITHYERLLTDLKSSGILNEKDYKALAEKLSKLSRTLEAGYSHDFPQDYIGIGGELLQ